MSCGCLVVASNIGGIGTYVKDGYNGLLFNPGDLMDLTNKIKTLLDASTTQKDALIRHALLTAEEYDGEMVTSRLYNYMENLL